jgi:hypothetical protein
VPFKGTPETVNGLLTGSVDIIYAANVTVNPLIEAARCGRSPSSTACAGLDGQHPDAGEAAGLPNSRTCRSGSGWCAEGNAAPIIASCSRRSCRSCPTRRCGRSRAHRRVPDHQHARGVRPLHRPEADRWSRVLKETGIKYD